MQTHNYKATVSSERHSSPLWSPVSIQLVNQLESVQRRFTKRLPGFNSFRYDEQCTRLGINRLERRRLHADIILCYKIIHVYISLSPDSFFTVVRDRTRGHSLKLSVPVRVINVRYEKVYMMKSFTLASYRGSKLI